MRSNPRPRACLAALAVALSLGMPGCGEDERPFRVGVVVDCVGIARSFEGAELSGAQLPLIERGARRRGTRPTAGITSAEVGGRPVEIVKGCTEAFEFSTLTRELRRLAEVEHVDAIIAASTGADEVVLRDVARAHPDVVFLPVAHGPREVTTPRPARNIFRFAGDYGQGVAGLATYAYRRLGWRQAAIVLADWDAGWLARDAFVAEFCALGGTIAKHVAAPTFDPGGRDVRRVPRDVDGVAVFAGQFFGPARFLQRLARRADDPAREILVGPGVTNDPGLLRATAASLDGVAGSSYVDPGRMRSFLRAYARAFPGTPVDVAGSELVTGYRDAMEALLQSLERADGENARLKRELGGLRIDLLGGPVRLDDHRQAVVSTSLVRIGAGADPVLTPMLRKDSVDQSIGGLLDSSLSPSDRPAACTRRR